MCRQQKKTFEVFLKTSEVFFLLSKHLSWRSLKKMAPRKIIITTCIAVAFSSTFIYSFNSCKSHPQQKEEAIDTSAEEITGDYVGDKKCGACHQKEYADWKTSDHAK